MVDPFCQASPQFRSGLEGVEIDAFVFQGPPQPLDKDIVHPSPPAIHADANASVFQDVGKAPRVSTRPVKAAGRTVDGQLAPQHFLNFLPEPQGHGSFRPVLAAEDCRVGAVRVARQ